MVRSPTLSFPQYTGQLREQINAALARYARFGEGCPETLQQAVDYSLLGPGKRLRPILVLLAAEACGSTIEPALPAACAVEMVHAYSLVHDDLPAMDDDDLRRGRPTCHVRFSEATAILAGDALLTRAFEIISNELPDAVAARCCAILSAAAGAAGMVGGQVDDLAWERKDEATDDEDRRAVLESIHRRKTGAMFNAALALGAEVAEASDEERDALEQFGNCLGLAFQITDDLLDVAGDESTTGKRVGKDSDRGKLTYPSIIGTNESRELASEMIEHARAALAPLGPRATQLEALATYVLQRDR